MEQLRDFLGRDFWGATVGDYLAFIAIIIAATLLKRPFARLVTRLTAGIAVRVTDGKYRSLFKSLVQKPVEWLFAVIAFFYACNFIEAPLNALTLLHWNRKGQAAGLRAYDVVEHLFALFGIIFTTLLISRIVDFMYRAQQERAQQNLERERTQLLPLLKDVVKIVLWTMGFFWLLGVVFHVNIPALITGLGIGGVALALAAKESIENLFASFTILADKPFTVDDSVRLGSVEGKVERIGFRSTRLRTADGSLLIVPNKKLIDDNLENLSGRDKRKLKITVPLKYRYEAAALESLKTAIAGCVAAETQLRGDVKVFVDAFTENTAQLLVVFHFPDDLPEDEIQKSKSDINTRIYALIAESNKALV